MKQSKDTPLARTRPELLKMCLKSRFFDFPLLSLFTFIFLIPLLAWIIFSNYVLVEQINEDNLLFMSLLIYLLCILSNISFLSSFLVSIYTNGLSAIATPSTGYIAYSVSLFNEDNFLFMSLLIYLPYIPLGMIFGLGVSGALNYSKRLSFQEGANVINDFFHGIAKNIGMNLLVFFLIFFFYALLKISSLLLIRSMDNIPATILIGVMYAGFFILLMIFFFVLTQTILYKGNFWQLFINGIRFMVGMFGWNLLIFLVILLPFLVYEFVPFSIAQYIAIAISLLFYFGFSIFLFTLYSHSLFDLTINQDYPEIYRKGLTKEEEKSSSH